MAVKIAHAMGAEVTVLSQSLKKQEDGLRLGADHYYATSDPDTFEQLAGRFDLIVNTVSASIDLDAYLGLLAVDGTLVNVGAPAEPLSVNVVLAHRRPPLLRRLDDRRHRPDPGDARLLRRAQHRRRGRGHRGRQGQRGLRAGPRLRRPLPLRHRHQHPRLTYAPTMSRIFTTSFASVYPHYVTKAERKGRTKAEVDEVIEWLTGFDERGAGRAPRTRRRRSRTSSPTRRSTRTPR